MQELEHNRESSKFNGHREEYRKVIKGDAWFGSVKAAAALANNGMEGVLQVKTGHSLFPKKIIEEALAGAPGGIHIVLRGYTGSHPSGKVLVAP